MKSVFLSITLLVSLSINEYTCSDLLGSVLTTSGLTSNTVNADKLLKNPPVPVGTVTNLVPVRLPNLVGTADDSSPNNDQSAAGPTNSGTGVLAAPVALGKKVKKVRQAPNSSPKVDDIFASIPTEKPAPDGERYPELFDLRFGLVGIVDDERLLRAMCSKDDESCLDSFVKSEADPSSGKDDRNKKVTQEKKIDKAVQEAKEKAEKDMKDSGGPPPFGGFQLVDTPIAIANPIEFKPQKTSRNGSKSNKKSRKANQKNKNSNNGDEGPILKAAPPKQRKATTTTTITTTTTTTTTTLKPEAKTEEPDVATAPD